MGTCADAERLPCGSWIHVLCDRAESEGKRTAYLFLADGEDQELRLTYAHLDRQARAVAVLLRQNMAAGERALLLYPPGLEFIAGLFGCWYAGVIAVPAYPPSRSGQPSAMLETLAAITQDSRPSA